MDRVTMVVIRYGERHEEGYHTAGSAIETAIYYTRSNRYGVMSISAHGQILWKNERYLSQDETIQQLSVLADVADSMVDEIEATRSAMLSLIESKLKKS